MAEHTPGPWWVAGKGTIRCGVKGTASEGWIGGVHFRNRSANARLIAAAPELLEALTWAVDHFDGNTRCNAEQEQNCIEICRAAIAKARGAA